jgi:hypothetical protein
MLYPVAKPTAVVLDKWLGQEGIQFFQEKDLRELLKIHVNAPETEIEKVEGKGALNFLAMDDLSIVEEGEPIDPKSIIELSFINSNPVFPTTEYSCEDPFLNKVQESGKKWIILTDATGEPHFALNAHTFLRSALFEKTTFDPFKCCHRPIVIRDARMFLGEALVHLKVYPKRLGDDVIDEDIIVFWGDEQRRVITGSDVLGRLLRGIAQQEKTIYQKIRFLNG